MINLNDFLPPGSGWTLEVATSINNQGQIVGWGRISDTIRAFLLTPLGACPGDVDGDGQVGIADALALLAAWGPNPGHPADINGDGQVGLADFLGLFAAWGPC